MGRLAADFPPHESVAYPIGGFYVMRDGWESSANFLMLDCGPTA